MRRYLLVDDNLEFTENLAEILADDGAECTVVAGGPQALQEARSTRFDAVVTDMRMPVMSGAKLVHEIRAIDPGLPAIVVSAYTGEDDLTAARKEGLLAVLSKPVPIPRLRELLRGARRSALVAVVEDDPALADNLAEFCQGGVKHAHLRVGLLAGHELSMIHLGFGSSRQRQKVCADRTFVSD